MMHGIIRLFLPLAACLLSISVAEVSCTDADLFQGNFAGIATGDGKTSAPLTLNLTQNGSWVSGSITILPGISINTGGLICPGTVAVPSGKMGINYLELPKFESSGILVKFQDYKHPVYTQRFPGFEPYMGVLDLLMNHGDQSLPIILAQKSVDYGT